MEDVIECRMSAIRGLVSLMLHTFESLLQLVSSDLIPLLSATLGLRYSPISMP